GGGADIIGRIIAQSLQEKLGQPAVIENRPGAAGTLGNEAVARADKDGYTLGIMTAGQIIAAVMNKSLRYDTLTAFDPVLQVATAGLILVTRPDLPGGGRKAPGRGGKGQPRKILLRQPGLGRHAAFPRRPLPPDRRHQHLARAVSHLARSDLRRSRQAGRRAVRYGVGGSGAGSGGAAPGARRHGQGSPFGGGRRAPRAPNPPASPLPPPPLGPPLPPPPPR